MHKVLGMKSQTICFPEASAAGRIFPEACAAGPIGARPGLRIRARRYGFAGAMIPVLAAGLAGVLAGVSSSPQARADKPACEDRRGVLGVSRVVEVDTGAGPRFGNMQYPDIDFLKPGEVVLTFDDGPLRVRTIPVLNALERHCTKATFFMVGRMAVSDPEMVKEIARRGHTVATHTWSHKNLNRLSNAGATREIELGVSAVSAALGRPAAPFFRFPYLADPKAMQGHLRSRGIGNFSIDVDSVDFRTRSGQRMADRIMSGLKSKGKGILLFHDIQRSTAAGLDALLDRLAANGFKVVHLVSKSPVKTLTSYDKIALEELERRDAAAKRPLARRSIVWPVALDAVPEPEPLAYVRPGPTFKRDDPAPLTAEPPERRPGAPRTDAASPERSAGQASTDDEGSIPLPSRSGRPASTAEASEPGAEPVKRQTSSSQPAPAESVRSTRLKRPEADWRDTIFQN